MSASEPMYIEISDDEDSRPFILIDSDDETQSTVQDEEDSATVDGDDEADSIELLAEPWRDLDDQLVEGLSNIDIDAGIDVPRGYVLVGSLRMYDKTFHPGTVVELLPSDNDGTTDSGDFFRIHHLLEDLNDNLQPNHILRGVRLRRAKCLDGKWERKRNEVVMMQRMYLDGKGREIDCSMEDISWIEINPHIRLLICTNRKDDEMTFKNDSWQRDYYYATEKQKKIMQEQAYLYAQLVCRFTYTVIYKSAAAMRSRAEKGRVAGEKLRLLGFSECDPDWRTPERVLRQQRKAAVENSQIQSTSPQPVGLDERYSKGKGPAREVPSNLRSPAPLALSVNERTTISMQTVVETRTNQHGSYKRRMTTPVREEFASKSRSRRASDRPQETQPYTFGDLFGGCGGASEGARQAGLEVLVMFDKDPIPCINYRLNFPGSKVFEMEAHDFITKRARSFKVDILHISFPCQAFSPMNTKRGNFEENSDTILSLGDILQAMQPRVVVFEETYGLSSYTDFQQYFRHVLQAFTRFHYSVHWKVMNFAAYGLAQQRKRLIMLAAAPGESLPSFPEATHNISPKHNDPTLKPCVTIHEALRGLSLNTPNHKVLYYPAHKRKTPYSKDSQVRSCVICTGGEKNWYPDGTRPFTDREFARLQGFFDHYVFRGSRPQIIKLIGNACPPIVFELIYAKCIQSLRATDLEDERERKRVITIDDWNGGERTAVVERPGL